MSADDRGGQPEPIGEIPAGGIDADLLGGFGDYLTPVGIAAVIVDLRYSIDSDASNTPSSAATDAYLETVIAALYEAGEANCGAEELEEIVARVQRQLYG